VLESTEPPNVTITAEAAVDPRSLAPWIITGQSVSVNRLRVRLATHGADRGFSRWWRGRFGAAFVTVGLAATLAACADSVPAVGLSGPGTPLAEGLVVPPDTRLIGPVFPQPDPRRG
jgi:hypothetical protein